MNNKKKIEEMKSCTIHNTHTLTHINNWNGKNPKRLGCICISFIGSSSSSSSSISIKTNQLDSHGKWMNERQMKRSNDDDDER